MRVRARTVDAGDALSGQLYFSSRTHPDEEWTDSVPSNPSYGTTGSIVEGIWDVPTPGFKKLIRGGAIICNDFAKTRTSVYHPRPVSLEHKTTTLRKGSDDGWRDVGFVWGGTYIPYSFEGNLPDFLDWDFERHSMKTRIMDLAVTDAYANINESDMLTLAALGEQGKTMDFLASTLKKVIKIAREVRKCDLRSVQLLSHKAYWKYRLGNKRFRAELAEIKNTYMEARYAVRPLFYDVNGVLDVIEKRHETNRKVFRGFSKDAHTSSDQLWTTPFYETEVQLERFVKYTVSARAGVLCVAEITDASSQGYTRVAESAWELMPWSFIVDWFANVGKTIAAHSPKAGVRHLASWVTVKENLTYLNKSGAVRSTAPKFIWDKDNFSSMSEFSYRREEYNLERVAHPVLASYPRYDVHLDGLKLLDLSMILSNFF